MQLLRTRLPALSDNRPRDMPSRCTTIHLQPRFTESVPALPSAQAQVNEGLVSGAVVATCSNLKQYALLVARPSFAERINKYITVQTGHRVGHPRVNFIPFGSSSMLRGNSGLLGLLCRRGKKIHFSFVALKNVLS